MFVGKVFTIIYVPESWQKTDGFSYAMVRASCVQYSLSCPPMYVIRTKQAICAQKLYV